MIWVGLAVFEIECAYLNISNLIIFDVNFNKLV